jgi:hypothetical protein
MRSPGVRARRDVRRAVVRRLPAVARRVLHASSMKPEKPTQDENQGEGDRVSARRYNQDLREFIAGGKVEPAAREAEAYVERAPSDAARAERTAKRGPEPTRVSLEELMAKGRTMIDRVRNLANRITRR